MMIIMIMSMSMSMIGIEGLPSCVSTALVLGHQLPVEPSSRLAAMTSPSPSGAAGRCSAVPRLTIPHHYDALMMRRARHLLATARQ
jgi:hypothetical protein